MPHPDLDAARRLCSALRNIVIHKFGGWNDRESLRQFKLLCSAAEAAVDDEECRHKLQLVRTYAADLFSEHGHHKWRRNHLAGADFLRLEILEVLDSFRTRLASIEAALRAELKHSSESVRQAGSPHKPHEGVGILGVEVVADEGPAAVTVAGSAASR